MANKTKGENAYLLHLIFCALNEKEPLEAEGIDFCALFELAKKQEIYSLINDEIQALSFVPDEAKTLFRNQTFSELNRLIALGAERKTILSEFDENDIRYMPLKGLVFKDYYPKESMRQMTDNDILIDEENRKKAADVMLALSYEPYDTTQNSDDFFKKPFYTFELHRSLFDAESEFSPRFDNVWQNAEQDENRKNLFHMSKEDVYVFSVCHMFKHYVKKCCGLRFLVDIFLFLRKEENSLDWQYINSELEKNALSDYEKQTKTLAKKLFNGEDLTDDEEKLLKNYTEFGLFGDEEGKILQKYSAASGTKAVYIFRRLFPKRKEIIASYPVLEKAPILYPFMLIHRFFKGLFNIRKTTDELKTVKEIKKENRG